MPSILFQFKQKTVRRVICCETQTKPETGNSSSAKNIGCRSRFAEDFAEIKPNTPTLLRKKTGGLKK